MRMLLLTIPLFMIIACTENIESKNRNAESQEESTRNASASLDSSRDLEILFRKNLPVEPSIDINDFANSYAQDPVEVLDAEGKPYGILTTIGNKLRMHDGNGSPLPGWPVAPLALGQGVVEICRVASGNVTKDKAFEIVVLYSEANIDVPKIGEIKLAVINLNGEVEPSFPIELHTAVRLDCASDYTSSLVLKDLSKNGLLDIFVSHTYAPVSSTGSHFQATSLDIDILQGNGQPVPKYSRKLKYGISPEEIPGLTVGQGVSYYSASQIANAPGLVMGRDTALSDLNNDGIYEAYTFGQMPKIDGKVGLGVQELNKVAFSYTKTGGSNSKTIVFKANELEKSLLVNEQNIFDANKSLLKEIWTFTQHSTVVSYNYSQAMVQPFVALPTNLSSISIQNFSLNGQLANLNSWRPNTHSGFFQDSDISSGQPLFIANADADSDLEILSIYTYLPSGTSESSFKSAAIVAINTNGSIVPGYPKAISEKLTNGSFNCLLSTLGSAAGDAAIYCVVRTLGSDARYELVKINLPSVVLDRDRGWNSDRRNSYSDLEVVSSLSSEEQIPPTTNSPPRFINQPTPVTVKAGSIINYNLPTIDEDGDALSYNCGDVTFRKNLDQSSGNFSWVPGPGDVGSHVVRFTVSDGKGGVDSTSITFIVEEPAKNSSVNLTNPQNRYDVNNDGAVTSLDALLIINFMNSGAPMPTKPGAFFYDVNGDGRITSIDSLQIINFLNTTP